MWQGCQGFGMRCVGGFGMGCLVLGPSRDSDLKCRAYRITVVHARAVLQAPSERTAVQVQHPERWCSILSTGHLMVEQSLNTLCNTLCNLCLHCPPQICICFSQQLSTYQELLRTHSIFKPVFIRLLKSRPDHHHIPVSATRGQHQKGRAKPHFVCLRRYFGLSEPFHARA